MYVFNIIGLLYSNCIWLYNPLGTMLQIWQICGHIKYDRKQSWWLTPHSSFSEHLNRGRSGRGEVVVVEERGGRLNKELFIMTESFPCDASYFRPVCGLGGWPGVCSMTHSVVRNSWWKRSGGRITWFSLTVYNYFTLSCCEMRNVLPLLWPFSWEVT